MASAVPVSPGVSKLADGFYSIAGAAVDAKGTLYFIDRFFQSIHSWSEAKGLNIVADAPLDAVNLAVDRSGHLLVQSSAFNQAMPQEFRVTARQWLAGDAATLAGAGVGLCLLGLLLATCLRRLPGVDATLHASGAQVAFRFNSYIALALADRLLGAQGVALIAILIALA